MGIFGISKNKKELKEAHLTLKHLERPKAKKMLSSTKGDPTRAITEAQPFQVNQEKPRAGLSHYQHRDVWGREIREPDLTNPTRNRWERPLDTVKSFQDSIERGYRRSYTEYPSPPPTDRGSHYSNRNYYCPQDQMSYGQHTNRTGGYSTPMSNNSTEGPVGFGAFGGRNNLNDDLVMANNQNWNNRNRNYSNASGWGGYPDTGYGGSPSGSRGESSGTLEPENSWSQSAPTNGFPASIHAPAHGPSSNVASPLQQHVVATPTAPTKHIIKLGNPNSSTPPAAQDGQRKGWLSRKLSKR